MPFDEFAELLAEAMDNGDITDPFEEDWSTYDFDYEDPYALADVFDELLANGAYTEIDDVLAGFESQTMSELRDLLGDEEFDRVTSGTRYSQF